MVEKHGGSYDAEPFKVLLENTALLSEAAAMKREFGFTFDEFISQRRILARGIDEIATNIEEVVHNTGIARTTGGGVGILSGAAIIGGILAAPFSGGLSLGLTIGGAAGGVGSAATTLTASHIKDKRVNEGIEDANKRIKNMEQMEKSIKDILDRITNSLEKIRRLNYDDSTIEKVVRYALKGGVIAYRGHQVYSVS